MMMIEMNMENTEFSPMVVMHPIFEIAMLMDKEGVFNAMEDTERYERFKGVFKSQIKECKDISSVVWHIRKSYRLTFISYLNKVFGVDMKICGNLLGEHWVHIETLTTDANVSPKRVLQIIKSADKNEIMDSNELEIYNNLDEELTIYRGCRNKNGAKACSWTFDEEKARWFANRYGHNGYLYKAKLNKKDAIAYIDHEKEIIADFNKLYDIELLEH
jgi:hypothetical protein